MGQTSISRTAVWRAAHDTLTFIAAVVVLVVSAAASAGPALRAARVDPIKELRS